MSDIFALDTQGQDRVAEQARANPFDPSQVSHGAFSNLPAAVGDSLLRGGARLSQGVGRAFVGTAAKINQLENDLPDTSDADPFFRAVDETATNAVDYWTPDSHTTGAVGRVLGGFGEIVLPLMAGGAPGLIGTQMFGTAGDLAREGVDPTTAITAGSAEGAATALGFKVPFLGSTLARRMVSGAAGNLVVNAGTTAVTGELLHQRGYEELAKNYNAADFEARAVDVLTGLLFGGVHHAFSGDASAVNPRLPEAVADAVLTARNAKNFQETTAPGVIPDIASSVAHQDALTAAIDHLSRSEAVNVGDAVAAHEGAVFADDGKPVQLRDAVAKLVREEPPDDVTLPLNVKGLPEVTPDAQLAPRAEDAPLVRDDLTAPVPVIDGMPVEKQTTPEFQSEGEPISPPPPTTEAATPEIQGLRELAAQHPEASIHAGFDEDGNPVRSTVAAEAKRIEDEHTQAVTDAKAYDAAVQCFLGNGA